MRKPLIVFDGRENLFGRALFCVSSLYFAEPWFSLVTVRFIDIESPDVLTALAAARWDLGIEIEAWERSRSCLASPLAGATVYAGVAYRSAAGMRLDEAQAGGVAPVVMLQHPDANWLSASTLLHAEMAFDPRRFADHLGAMVKMLS